MKEDRCLVRLEELTGELETLMKQNEVLKTENHSLKKVIISLKDENKEYREKLNKCGLALEACGGTNGD